MSMESGQVGCALTPPLLSATFESPWQSANLCPGTSYPRTESLVRKGLEMGALKGLFKFKMTRKRPREGPSSLCQLQNKQALACEWEPCLYAGG